QGPSTVSLGPFAISRASYEKIYSKLPKALGHDEATIILGFKRLQYEKLGALWAEKEEKEEYGIHAEEESLYRFFSLMTFWDITKPEICEDFVWIKPNKKCKRFAERLAGKKFAEDNYWWWHVLIDFEESLHSLTPINFPDRYRLSPAG